VNPLQKPYHGPATPGVLLFMIGGAMVVWALASWGVLPQTLAPVQAAIPATAGVQSSNASGNTAGGTP